jgi:hypothetical protein
LRSAISFFAARHAASPRSGSVDLAMAFLPGAACRRAVMEEQAGTPRAGR